MGRDKQIKSVASRESAEVREVERGQMCHLPKASWWLAEDVGGMGGEWPVEDAIAQSELLVGARLLEWFKCIRNWLGID